MRRHSAWNSGTAAPRMPLKPLRSYPYRPMYGVIGKSWWTSSTAKTALRWRARRALGGWPALTDSTFWSTKERPASSSGRAGRHRSGLCEVAQRTERHTETETPVLRPVPNGPGGEDDSGVEQAVNG